MSKTIIEVPTDVLQVGGGVWVDSAFVYALDSTTIGIAGQEMLEWKEAACFNETIPIRKGKGKIVLQIPERFSRFYGIGRRHWVVSVNGNAVLVTVSGRVVEEKKYPS